VKKGESSKINQKGGRRGEQQAPDMARQGLGSKKICEIRISPNEGNGVKTRQGGV